MDDYISRQAAIDAVRKLYIKEPKINNDYAYDMAIDEADDAIRGIPSAQPEPHYCRECKWSMCHIDVDKHGESETYWRCLNWDGGTDEEGYCHEWERRTE